MSDQLPPPPPAGPPAPMPAPAPGPSTSNNAVVALVLAIASFFVCPVVAAVAALFVASSADKQIKASGGWVTGEGLVTAAKVISWINIAITVVAIIGFVVFALAVGVSSSTSS